MSPATGKKATTPIGHGDEGPRPRIDDAHRRPASFQSGQRAASSSCLPASAMLSSCVLRRSGTAALQHVALGAEDRQRRIRGARSGRCTRCLGAGDAELGHERGLAECRVGAGRLAERGGVAFDIEQIVGDLGMLRRARGRNRRAPCTGRAWPGRAVRRRCSHKRSSAPVFICCSARDVDRLAVSPNRPSPARSSIWPPTMPPSPERSAPAPGSAAGAPSHRCGVSSRVMISNARVSSASPARIAVASSVCLVQRRAAAAQVAVVHRRQIVMDQRIAVDAFQRRADQQERPRAARRTPPHFPPPETAAAACRRRGWNTAWRPSAAAAGRSRQASSGIVEQQLRASSRLGVFGGLVQAGW